MSKAKKIKRFTKKAPDRGKELNDEGWTLADLEKEMLRRNIDIDIKDINVNEWLHYENPEQAAKEIERYYYGD